MPDKDRWMNEGMAKAASPAKPMRGQAFMKDIGYMRKNADKMKGAGSYYFKKVQEPKMALMENMAKELDTMDDDDRGMAEEMLADEIRMMLGSITPTGTRITKGKPTELYRGRPL